MLKVHSGQVDTIVALRMQSLLDRIDLWLSEEFPHWSVKAPDMRQPILRDILTASMRAGLEIDMEHALFAGAVVRHGGDERSFLARGDVVAMIDDADWNPRSKVLRLDALSDPELPAEENRR